MGPLAGIRIVEFAGIGPGPFCAMLLADLGATIIRLDRTAPSGLGTEKPARFDLVGRGRSSVALDLKDPAATAFALRLLEGADALIEGFRPGAMERLGLGPDVVLARNPRLVYGRMTGFGQDGPLSRAAGHDINYVAITGALHAMGRRGQKPTPPLNLVGDYAGGSLYLALGLVCGILEARTSGRGQVVDAAISDGAAHLMTMFYGLAAAGIHSERRGENMLDSGSPIYDAYECADGGLISIGPIEAKFQDVLFSRLGIAKPTDPDALRSLLETTFRSKSRDEWCALLEGSDACFAPVLSMSEAPLHPHNVARGTFSERDGIFEPAPAPRFSRTPGEKPGPKAGTPDTTRADLAAFGLGEAEIAAIGQDGPVRWPAA